tara:strand:+ start:33866 stop:37015 length:3150 start_codon:yes stop_codon:yes gene_type:complete
MSEIHHDHNDHQHDEAELAAKKAARPKIEKNQANHWLSIDQYMQDPEFQKAVDTEFMSSPLREEEAKNPWARREFLKLMGASMALSTASCIRRPVQKIVPYNKQPEEVTFGVPNFYTSTFFDGQESLGVLIKTREGRPIKLESLTNNPLNQGGTSVRSQAHILSLYDLDRLTAPKKNLFNEKRTNKDTISVSWENADTAIVESLKKGGVYVLTGNIVSPSTQAIVKDFSEGFKATHVAWEVLANDDVRKGQKASYGTDVLPFYRFDKSKMTVSIDADFLGTWIAPTVFTKQYSKTRKDLANMSRMVAFDSNYSLTGANADIRVRIKPSQQLKVAVALAQELIVKQGKSSYAGNSDVKNWLNSFGNPAEGLNIEPALLKEIAKDLWDAKGESLVVAGGLKTQSETSLALQVVVNLLNSALENDGKTVQHKRSMTSSASHADMTSLIDAMKNKKVKTLVIHGVNPAYGLPAKAEFQEHLKNVETVVYIGDRMNETAMWANYVLPENHSMENWGDAEMVSGVFAIQQPAIKPMYDTQSMQITLMNWCFQAKVGPKRIQEFESYYDYLKNYWKTEIFPKHGKGSSFDKNWQDLLQTGSIGDVEGSDGSRSFSVSSLTDLKKPAAVEGWELVLYPTSQFGDGMGSQANIGWLHELPDPVTKAVWDNYASISIAAAAKLKVKEGSLIEITVGKDKMELPVLVQPGLQDDVIAIAVGYGRTHVGSVGNGIGKNAYELVQTNEKGQVLFAGVKAEVKVTGKKYEIAHTQTHHSMEGRQIVVEATLKEYQTKKDHIIHKHPIWSVWSGHQYNGHKWGMAIDLNSCTGCSACMTACQSENNIPVVGKKYVMQGREMHWIRIDRYYTGKPEDAHAVFQPVMCQHCDNAPCETVCPVLATVHSSEGLNEMVYNRCVGTRYCSNNCPYKVRRFNWFNYAKKITAPGNMALNPDVGVRVRGVMEKCTFCVQRIKEGKNNAKLENRPLKDGEIKTACQTSCPTDAIVFGDMNDANSQVSKLFKNERSYALLEEWHAAPSVRYQAKIRNNGKDQIAASGAHEGGH